MADAKLQIIISAIDNASRVLVDVGKKSQKSMENLSAITKTVGTSFTAVGATITGALALSVKAFDEGQAAVAQLNAVLASTKGVAGVTADSVTKLATEMQRLTTFDDETIIGAENLLLTFTNIGKDVFPQATKTVLDMAIALGQDTKSGAMQLGKALQDPIRGAAALRKVGVNFTADQEKLIKTMVDTGDVMGAQKLILSELATEFGGSASAKAQTFGGRITVLKNQLGDLMEQIGSVVVPVLEKLVKFIEPIVEKIIAFSQENPKLFATIVTVVAAIGALLVVLGPLLIILPGIVTACTLLAAAIAAITWPVVLVIAIIAALIAIGYLLITHWEEVKSFAVSVWGTIASFISTTWDNVISYLIGVWNYLKETTTSVMNGIKDFLITIWDTTINAIKTVINFEIGLILLFFKKVFGVDLVEVFTNLYTFIVGTLGKMSEFFTMLWQNLTIITTAGGEVLKSTWGFIWDAVSSHFMAIWNGIKTIIDFFAPFFSATFEAGKEIILGVWTSLWTAVKDTAVGIFDEIKETISSIVKWITDKIAAAKAAYNSAKSFLSGGMSSAISAGSSVTKFASGGIVTRATNAIVGEAGPEAIIPLNKLGGFGTNYVVNILGGTYLSENVAEDIGNKIISKLMIAGQKI